MKKYTATRGVILNVTFVFRPKNPNQKTRGMRRKNEPYKLHSSSLDSLKMGTALPSSSVKLFLFFWNFIAETMKWITCNRTALALARETRCRPQQETVLTRGSLAAAPAGKLRHQSLLARILAARCRLPRCCHQHTPTAA